MKVCNLHHICLFESSTVPLCLSVTCTWEVGVGYERRGGGGVGWVLRACLHTAIAKANTMSQWQSQIWVSKSFFAIATTCDITM